MEFRKMLMITLYVEHTPKKETQYLQNSLLDAVGEGEGGMFQENSIKTCILSRVKQITNPGWMHETSAWTWCTGKTQRDRMEREVGEGIGMGNTCKPMTVSFQCMTKSSTNKKNELCTYVYICIYMIYIYILGDIISICVSIYVNFT